MKKLILFTFFLLSLAISDSHAQSRELPKAVDEAFYRQYPTAGSVTWQENLLNIWVSFTFNGDQMKAYYTRKGQWKYTEKDWTFDKLPEAVKDGFRKSKFADREVEETKVVYRAGGTERYRLKTRKNDLQKKNLYFTEEGRLVEEGITL